MSHLSVFDSVMFQFICVICVCDMTHSHAWHEVFIWGFHMGWLRLVGSLKLQVSFAKEPYERDHILQKRPIIIRSLLIVATPYAYGPLDCSKTLQHTVTHCNTLQHTATHCNTLQHTATRTRLLVVTVICSVLQCVAVCCGVLRCVAECCGVLLYGAVCCNDSSRVRPSRCQCAAVCCVVVWCVAVCCGVLQQLFFCV